MRLVEKTLSTVAAFGLARKAPVVPHSGNDALVCPVLPLRLAEHPEPGGPSSCGQPLYRTIFAIGLLRALLLLAMATGVASSQPIPLLAPAPSSVEGMQQIPPEAQPVLELLRQRSVVVNPEALAALAKPPRMGMLPAARDAELLLNLFPDTALHFRPLQVKATNDGIGTQWFGTILLDGGPSGEAILTRHGSALVGTVHLKNGEHYRIEVESSGAGQVRQLRFHGYPAGAPDDAVPVGADANGVVRGSPLRGVSTDGFPTLRRSALHGKGPDVTIYTNGSPAVIDVLVLFTSAAGGADENLRQALASTWIAETNAILQRSLANIQLRLVRTAHSPWTDTNTSWTSFDYTQTLNALTSNGDGQLDFIHSARDEAGADLVVMIVAPQRGSGWTVIGKANLMSNDPVSFAPFAFSVVHREFAGGPSNTFAHEVGHNLGLAHDTANSPQWDGISHSARGYQQKLLQPTFFTVMAYANGCNGCQAIPHYSNPDVDFQLIPTGVRGEADAAAALRFTGPIAALWRSPPPAQACTFAVKGARPLPVEGMALALQVETQPGCQWTAASTVPWLRITGSASGAGPGSVLIEAQANQGVSPREGGVVVAGQLLVFPQAAQSCQVQVEPRYLSIGNAAATLDLAVSVPGDCPFVIQSLADWLVVPGTFERLGSQVVQVRAGANTSGAVRTGRVRIQTVEVSVQQSATATPCRVEWAQQTLQADAAASQQAVAIHAEPGCRWEVALPEEAFVTIVGERSGTGDGTVNIKLEPNFSAVPRTAAVVLNGQAITITQSGQPARCFFTADPTGTTLDAAGGTFTIAMSAAAGCQWQVDTGANWVVQQVPFTNQGQASLVFRITPNPSALSRTTVIRLGAASVTVHQQGVQPPASCSYSVSHLNLNYPFQDTTQLLQVVTDANCPWAFDTQSTWLHVAQRTGIGPAQLRVRAEANSSIAPRNAFVSIGRSQVNVIQAASPLSLRLWPSPQVLLRQVRTGIQAPFAVTVTARLGNTSTSLAISPPTADWMREGLPASSTQAPFEVSLDAASLPPGIHNTTLGLTNPAGLAPPAELPVVLQVRAQDSIRVSPQSLSFRSAREAGPAAQWLDVWGAPSPPVIEALTMGGAWLRAELYEEVDRWRVKVQPASSLMPVGKYDAAVVIRCQQGCASVAIPVRFVVEPVPDAPDMQATTITSGGIVNAASFAQGTAASAWTSLFGLNLAKTSRAWQASDFDGDQLPLALEGVRVTVGGKTAALSFVSPTQVNFLTPQGLPVGWTTVEINGPSGMAQAEVWVGEEAPGIFTFDGSQVAALHPDGTAARVPPSGVSGRVTRPGDTLAVFGTGFGATITAPPSDRVLTAPSPLQYAQSATVTIGGVPTAIRYIGLTGTGLNQFNVVVPHLPPGIYSMELALEGVPTQLGAILHVERPAH